MKTRLLLLGIMAAGLTQAAAITANAVDIDYQTPDTGLGVIHVDGPYQGTYDEVPTETINYVVQVRGYKPAGAVEGTSKLELSLFPEGKKLEAGPIAGDWKRYKLSAPPYDDERQKHRLLRSWSAIKLCNDRLNQVSGAAREEFLNKGVTFKQEGVHWRLRGEVSWVMSDSGVRKAYVEQLEIPVKINCMALNQIISKTTFRIEPAKVTQMGKFLCPTELKLHGYAKMRGKFYGKSIFVGPHYLSPLTVLNYQAAGNRNAIGTYKINWQQAGGFTTAPNKEPKTQDLTFQFNIADKDGKLVKSTKERVEVSCRKIKVNAPTAGDGMTVSPTN